MTDRKTTYTVEVITKGIEKIKNVSKEMNKAFSIENKALKDSIKQHTRKYKLLEQYRRGKERFLKQQQREIANQAKLAKQTSLMGRFTTIYQKLSGSLLGFGLGLLFAGIAMAGVLVLIVLFQKNSEGN